MNKINELAADDQGLTKYPASALRHLSERPPDDQGEPDVGLGPTWIMVEDEWYALRALLAAVGQQQRRE